ncbi:MAG: hypothetical protein HYV46_15885 [candidate division NC10 bacterium]|nr:hypothetical protein [candidate division NC10 bacterium]
MRRFAKASVQAHEVVTPRASIGPHKRAGQFQSIRRSERVKPKQADGLVSDLGGWRNLRPALGQAIQEVPRPSDIRRREISLPAESGKR